jgi:hypothetical protein
MLENGTSPDLAAGLHGPLIVVGQRCYPRVIVYGDNRYGSLTPNTGSRRIDFGATAEEVCGKLRFVIFREHSCP